MNVIDFLLSNANPSIKYRVKKEVLDCITPEVETELQAEILNEDNIQTIINSQKPNGFIGNNLHGQSKKKGSGTFDNQETGVKYLIEKGVRKDSEVIKNAMKAYTDEQILDIWGMSDKNKYNEFVLAANGANLIRCAGIAKAGYDDVIDISKQIQLSLDSFKRVLEVASIFEVTREYHKRNLHIFNENEKWPCQYHLIMLANTYAWRTHENLIMLTSAIEKLIEMPEKKVETASWVGYPLGTLGAFSYKLIHNFDINEVPWSWFEIMELVARCGIVKYSKILQNQVSIMKESINSDGICKAKINDKAFKGWGPYGGLQLEVDWKSKVRKDCDVTFRALMILYHSRFL